jgi:hypothetical protein
MDSPMLAGLTETLVRIAKPWATLYGHSKAVSTTVVAAHVLSLFIGGGIALAADRLTLRAARASNEPLRRQQLVELGDTHAWALGGLGVLFVSGVLLFASDVDTFMHSITFWVKMTLIVSLLVNGLRLTRGERLARSSDATAWPLLRSASMASAVLWVLTTLAGVVLANAS